MNTNDLKGSEKQIAWATEIRANYTKQLTALKDMMAAAKADMSDPRRAGMIAKLDAVAAVTSAAWWIDNRHYLKVGCPQDLANGTLRCILDGDVKMP